MSHESTRTLVKSPPEVWAQCSDPQALERHLGGSFGEIRITRLEPETAVSWEGDQARGTVRIEPSAWGTRVTLTADLQGAEETAPETEAAETEAAETAPAPVLARTSEPAQRPAVRRALWVRLARGLRASRTPTVRTPAADGRVSEAELPSARSGPTPEPSPAAPGPIEILSAALDSLGAAHHRPFSRS